MKSRKITYFLTVVVLTFWGLISYKLFTRLDSRKTASETVVTRDTVNQKTERETLKLNYPDPFLKGIKKVQNDSTKIKRKILKKQKTEEINVAYLGKVYIGGNVYYMLSENDTCRNLRAGRKTPSGVKILKEIMDTLVVEKNRCQYRLSITK